MKRTTTKRLAAEIMFVVGIGMLTACSSSGSSGSASSSGSSGLASSSGSSGTSVPTVDILNLANVPALTDIVDGITSGLKAEYGANGIKIDSEDANGDVGVAQTIASQFVGDKPDVIATVATASLQAVLNKTKTIPVMFAAVSDPVTAGAVKSLNGSTGTNVSGIYNVNPIGDVLDLTKEMVPNNNKVGILYNPGESNSVTAMKLAIADAEARHMVIVKAPVNSSNDVESGAQSLIGKVGSIIVIDDTTVVTGQAGVFQVARAAHIPVFTTVEDSVTAGAIVGVGASAKATGEELAQMIIKELKGTKPGDIPLQPEPKADLFVNKTAASATGFTIPASVLSRATVVTDGK